MYKIIMFASTSIYTHTHTLNRSNNAFSLCRLHVHIFGLAESGTIVWLAFFIVSALHRYFGVCSTLYNYVYYANETRAPFTKQRIAASTKGDDNENNEKHSKQFLILFLVWRFRLIFLRWRCRCGFLFGAPLFEKK